MTSSHSRTRSTQDPYLHPTVRQRAISSSGGSPHSFTSNLAVVAGPTALSGQYYGVFLGEPPKGFPSSHLSSEPASPGHSHNSTGTSNGSAYGSSFQHSDTRSKRSSVAFPTTTSAPMKQEPVSRSRHISTAGPAASHMSPEYHTIRADASGSRRTSVAPAKMAQPPVMPPSAMKRERRSTLSGSSGSSEELPAADLRYLCKFAMGSISECLRRVSSNRFKSILCINAVIAFECTNFLSPHEDGRRAVPHVRNPLRHGQRPDSPQPIRFCRDHQAPQELSRIPLGRRVCPSLQARAYLRT